MRKGLLYAGTERGVWVSFNDGANWQTLRRNLPIVPVHDLAVKEGDLDCGDARPIVLDSRRSFCAASDESDDHDERVASLQAARRVSREFQRRWRKRARGRSSDGSESAVGAVVYYWLKNAEPARDDGFPRFERKSDSQLHERAGSEGCARFGPADSIKTARADSLKKAGVKADSTARIRSAR